MTEARSPRRILFLYVHNSCRSQMAAGLMRHLGGGRFEAHSARLERRGVHRLAVRAMVELGIDISGQRSKTIEELEERDFDVVVTTCQEAQEACPRWLGQAEVVHWSLPDPAAGEGSEAERMAAFRHMRDAIAEGVRELLGRCA